MHNKQILKQVIAHRKADEIIKGKYWKNGKGCCIGCIAETSDNPHEKAARLLGIPVELAYLSDTLFEGLPNGDAKMFPERFVMAIDTGKDYSLVWYKFNLFCNKENLKLQKRQAKKHPELKEVYDKVIPVIEGVILLLEREGDNKCSAARSARSAARSADSAAESAVWSARSVADSAAWSARSAARSAALSAVWSARSSARSAAWSADSAAESAVWSARSVARSAAWSSRSVARSAWSARSAARSAASAGMYKKMANTLIKLLGKETKLK